MHFKTWNKTKNKQNKQPSLYDTDDSNLGSNALVYQKIDLTNTPPKNSPRKPSRKALCGTVPQKCVTGHSGKGQTGQCLSPYQLLRLWEIKLTLYQHKRYSGNCGLQIDGWKSNLSLLLTFELYQMEDVNLGRDALVRQRNTVCLLHGFSIINSNHFSCKSTDVCVWLLRCILYVCIIHILERACALQHCYFVFRNNSPRTILVSRNISDEIYLFHFRIYTNELKTVMYLVQLVRHTFICQYLRFDYRDTLRSW